MIGRNKIRIAQEVVTLQYANGKSVARLTAGTGRFQPYIGFHIEAGRDQELDTTLATAKIASIEIKHQRPGGAEIVRHWNLGEQVNFFPVTSGPVALTVAGSLAERNAKATAEAGIGMRWGSNERSRMAIRGYLEILVRLSSFRLVQLAVRSRMTDVLLATLIDHARVCEAADSLVDRGKHPEVVAFHELALPMGPGNEEEWGKGDTTTVTPFISLHPKAIDADYLRSIWRSDQLHAAALRDWEGIQFWAQEYAATSDEAVRQAEEVVASGGDEGL